MSQLGVGCGICFKWERSGLGKKSEFSASDLAGRLLDYDPFGRFGWDRRNTLGLGVRKQGIVWGTDVGRFWDAMECGLFRPGNHTSL